MSLLENLLGSLGADHTDFTPPNSLCPGSCAIGPTACDECLPYKERLKDALYQVDHLDEFYAKYEVVGTTAATAGGTITCPYCGAPSADPVICDYCGMQIGQSDGKIQVSSANDIPDPIIEARDIIYERHSQVVQKYESNSGSGGLLSGLMDLLTGGEGDSGLGSRMSKEEITAAAASYGVSVSTYLNGLDNGTYGKGKAETSTAAATTVYTYQSADVRPGNAHRPPEPSGRPPQGRRDGLPSSGPSGPGGGGRPPRGGGPGGRR